MAVPRSTITVYLALVCKPYGTPRINSVPNSLISEQSFMRKLKRFPLSKEPLPMSRRILVMLAALIVLPAAAPAQTLDRSHRPGSRQRGGMDKLKSVQTQRITLKFPRRLF